MPQSIQGIVIALLISLLIGVIIGFYLRQSRINDLSDAVKQQKKRTEEVEQEHEKRLQEATLQLQKDYEQQLAEKIELYQTQYDQQVSELESEYNARLSMVGPAAAGMSPQALGASVMAAGAPADAVAIEQRIRKQYETRLKEAAQKIQQAYEQHLKLKLNESREALQQDYERRLAEKIEHYQDQLDAHLAQLPAAVGPMALSAGSGPVPVEAAVTGNADLSAFARDQLEAELRREYEQRLAEKIEHYQDDMDQRLQALEQEYEDRISLMQAATPEVPTPLASEPSQAQMEDLENQLSLQIEARLKAEYDQRLAEAIERYQDEMVERTQALEQEYETRLQLVQQQSNAAPAALLSDTDAVAAAEALLADSAFAAEPGAPPANLPEDFGDGPFPEAETDKTSEFELDTESPEISLQEEETVAPSELDTDTAGIPFPGADFADSATVESTLFSDQARADEGNLDQGEVEDLGLELEPPELEPPLEETPLDFGVNDLESAPPSPADSPQGNPLDLDDLLTLDDGENLVAEPPSMDDDSFNLDNLEDLLKEQETEDNSENLFDDLDDLSNLS